MPCIVFAGPPCSGKSTLAAELARRRRIPHLQLDTTRARIMPDSPHTRADRAVAYRAIHFAAELLLTNGLSVILDAPYGHPEDREEVFCIAGADLRLIECRVSPETAVKRFRARGPDPIRIDLTPERVDAMVRAAEYSGAGLLLDTNVLTPDECLQRIEAFV